jgi:hypothetical protein
MFDVQMLIVNPALMCGLQGIETDYQPLIALRLHAARWQKASEMLAGDDR